MGVGVPENKQVSYEIEQHCVLAVLVFLVVRLELALLLRLKHVLLQELDQLGFFPFLEIEVARLNPLDTVLVSGVIYLDLSVNLLFHTHIDHFVPVALPPPETVPDSLVNVILLLDVELVEELVILQLNERFVAIQLHH